MERRVCDDFDYIVYSSHNNYLGGVPDGIVDVETLNTEHPDLVERVIAAMK